MKVKRLVLLVATLAMTLGIGSSAIAQEATGDPTPSPTYALSDDGLDLLVDGQDVGSCTGIFREEQIELAQTGVYPTQVSGEARACEDLGVVNFYPAPYFYDTDGFFYTYDPVNDLYTSTFDETAGVYYVYDLVSHAFYSYDPVSGTYVPL